MATHYCSHYCFLLLITAVITAHGFLLLPPLLLIASHYCSHYCSIQPIDPEHYAITLVIAMHITTHYFRHYFITAFITSHYSVVMASLLLIATAVMGLLLPITSVVINPLLPIAARPKWEVMGPLLPITDWGNLEMCAF